MNHVRCIKVVSLSLVIAAAILGCKSKQENSGASLPTPQERATATAAPPQGKTAVPVVPSQDKVDAETAATRVLALMEAGDFPAIYKEAAAEFRQLGREEQFVEKFQQTRQKVGMLKQPQLISFGVVSGKGYVLLYRLENERYKSEFRLSFARSKSGKMELAGLNQHDELKK